MRNWPVGIGASCRQDCPMSLSFPKAANPAYIVGRTPWSARDASSRIRHNDISILQAREADGGVGCGPGGPPHQLCRLSAAWKTKGQRKNNFTFGYLPRGAGTRACSVGTLADARSAPGRGSVEWRLDAARRSACATAATAQLFLRGAQVSESTLKKNPSLPFCRLAGFR